MMFGERLKSFNKNFAKLAPLLGVCGILRYDVSVSGLNSLG
jgi:hypothetical protein